MNEPISTAELVKDKKQCTLTLKRLLIVESLNSINEYWNYHHEIMTDDSSIRKVLYILYIFSCILPTLSKVIPLFLIKSMSSIVVRPIQE